MRLLWLALLLSLCLTLTGDARPRRAVVSVTAYSWSGLQTASGRWPRAGHCAVSRDLERDLALRFGDLLQVHGVGTCTFTDRMHARWTRRIDLFMHDESSARRFGIRHQVLLVVL
jgi:3D (Asp-Asp-Asp) domain-containing protein